MRSRGCACLCAWWSARHVHIPDGSFTLQAGDNIYVTADSQDLAQLIKHLGIVKQKVRNAIIVGGSRIAYYLAMRCLHAGLGVKVIEQNHERCGGAG